MSEPLLVLGIDGLDFEKTVETAPNLLLETHKELNVSDYNTISTYTIWPTMYMGKSPYDIQKESSSINKSRSISSIWDDILRTAGSIVSPVLSENIRVKLGEILMTEINTFPPQKGGKGKFKGHTMFDHLKSRVIDVPGWNFRQCLGIQFDDVSLWDAILEDDGVERVYDILNEEIDMKIDITETALEYPYDIIWTHFHALDSIQHLFDRGIQKEWYQKVANDIQPLIENDSARDVIVLSDHGLENGDHRSPGIVATTNPEHKPLPEKPIEVRNWLEGILAGKAEENRERLKHLSDLGYVNAPDI